MAELNKISSFKSFTEIKNQEATMKLRETNNAKRQETVGKIGAILDEMGLTSLSELDEEKKQALINKMFGNVSEDEAEDIEDELNKLGKPKKLEEGNAFIYAAAKAKNAGKKTFQFNGKTYKVTLKTDTGLREDNSVEESVVNEGRSIAKIQYDWSKVTTQMQATAQNWKAAEGPAKESLLGKLKEMTAQKKALEAELDDAIADKDKDLELVVTEAFFRLPKDVIGNELYLATQNLSNLYGRTLAGNDIDTGVIDTIIKALTIVKKSVKKFNNKEEVLGTIYEAEKFKSTQDFEEFLEEIDGMPEVRIKRIMGNDYIDTPGGFRDEADDYDNDIVEYTLSNMGREDFEKLRAWWEENVQESAVNEGDMTKQYDGFIVLDSKSKKTYKFKYIKGTSNVNVENVAIDKLVKSTGEPRANFAVHGFVKKGEWAKDNTPVLESVNEGAAKQFEVDFDNMVKNIKSGYGWIDPEYVGDTWENSSDSVDFEIVKAEIYKRLIAAGLLAYANPDDEEKKGVPVRKLQELGIKESVVTEAEIKSDDEFKEYAMAVLKKAFGDEFDEAKAGEVVDGILKKCGDDYGACVGMLTGSLGESVTNEAFDANYWEDYHENAPKITNPSGMQIQQEVEAAVEEWNDNNEMGEENEVTPAGEKKVLALAKQFAKAKGYICHDVIDAMIMQES